MRIITGSARNTILQTLDGLATRPTAERVKEAVFSALQPQIENAYFLDLFSGSGQMGLEALSRGAAQAVLIDASPEAIAVIRANARKTRLEDRCRILRSGYETYLASFAAYHLYRSAVYGAYAWRGAACARALRCGRRQNQNSHRERIARSFCRRPCSTAVV